MYYEHELVTGLRVDEYRNEARVSSLRRELQALNTANRAGANPQRRGIRAGTASLLRSAADRLDGRSKLLAATPGTGNPNPCNSGPQTA